MKSQLVPLILGILFFGVAALSQENRGSSSSQAPDRYRGRDASRSGNRIAPEHEVQTNSPNQQQQTLPPVEPTPWH